MQHNTTSQRMLYMVRRWQVWFRLRRAFIGIQKGLLFGLAFAFGFSILLIVSGWGLRLAIGLLFYVKWFMSAGLGFALLAGLTAAFLPISPGRVTRFFDFYFGLHERISTALEIIQSPPKQPITEVAKKQLLDALAHGEQIKPEIYFFMPVQRSHLSLTGIVIFVTMLTALLVRPYFQQVQQQKAVRNAISAEISHLKEIQPVIEMDTTMSAEDKKELDTKIQETIQKLEQAASIEEAVAVLSQLEGDLQSLDRSDVQNQARALQQLGNQILQSETMEESNNPLERFGEALAEGDLIAAAQALQELDLHSLTLEEQQSLAEKLQKAADALTQASPELSGLLDQARQALESGDLQTAEQALQSSAQELAQTSTQIAQANIVREVVEQAEQSAQRLLEEGRQAQGSQANTTGQSKDGETGQGQSTSQEGKTGQTQLNSQGSGGSTDNQGETQGSGSGSGKGESDQSGALGSAAGSDPINQSNSPGDGGERPFAPMSDTQRLDGSKGSDVFLPDSQATGQEVVGQASSSPTESSSSTVPYTQVFSQYAETYRQVVDSGTIPTNLRSLVKKYFSNLEP
jgi:hypothetical protein